jgi:hypothetical protein
MKSSNIFHRSFLGLLLALGLAALPQVALAATGVSEERLSLPEGPGSLEGLGENISVNHNMGQMSYPVPIVVPNGYAGMTPVWPSSTAPALETRWSAWAGPWPCPASSA